MLDNASLSTLTAKLMGPAWGPSGADRTQVGLMLAPWTLLSGYLRFFLEINSTPQGLAWYHTSPVCVLLLSYSYIRYQMGVIMTNIESRQSRYAFPDQKLITHKYQYGNVNKWISITRAQCNFMFCYSRLISEIDGLVKNRRNSIANALELRLSCANQSRCCLCLVCHAYFVYNSYGGAKADHAETIKGKIDIERPRVSWNFTHFLSKTSDQLWWAHEYL